MISLSTNSDNRAIVLLLDAQNISNSTHLSDALKKNISSKSIQELKVFSSIDANGTEYIIAPFVKKEKTTRDSELECVRGLGCASVKAALDAQLQNIHIISELRNSETLAFAEGILLSNYKFHKYKSKSSPLLKEITLQDGQLPKGDIDTLNNIVKSVFYARDIVNEPLSGLKAKDLTASAQKIADEAGITFQELGIEKIQSIPMTGVLAVNKGSLEDPTFTVLEYKPDNAINSKPIVLVGKGVVYDSGGYSIKTGDGMMTMKCDMGGAAAVFGGIYLAALEKLPLHIISLVPAVENRINEKSFVPGDILTYSDGTTVEVLNTDAEGRLILADALLYAKQYNPELVFDFATLTGAAMRAIGSGGAAFMGTASEDIKQLAVQAANATYERIAELPLWDDFAEQIKSEIADITNLGGPLAGASTAGKFLEHFTDYPWLHFDIAGPAFLSHASSYRTVGGTGTGVRFLLEFFKRYILDVKK